MRHRLLLPAVMILAAIHAPNPSAAQERPLLSRDGRSLADRLDRLGRTILGGSLPAEPEAQQDSPTTRPAMRQSGPMRTTIQSNPAGAGRVLGNSSQPVRSQGPYAGMSSGSVRPADRSPGAALHNQPPTEPFGPPTTSVGSVSPSGSPAADTSDTRRLHDRLRDFGQSPFGEDYAPPSAVQGGMPSEAASSPPGASFADSAPEGSQPDAAQQPTLAPNQNAGAPHKGPRVAERAGAGGPSSSRAVDQTAPSGAGGTAAPSRSPFDDERTPYAGSLADRTDGELQPGKPSSPAEPTPAEAASPASAVSADVAAVQKGEGVLFTRQSPILSVETVGPRKITIGKESTYGLTVRNSAAVSADQVMVTVDLPHWAEVVRAEVTKGTTASAGTSPTGSGLLWNVGRLAGKAEERLLLRVVPRQSRPFDLVVKWDYTPAASQTVIEVQEPKLELRLEGPRDVLYGESNIYRLELVNTGTGDAEAVEISLAAIGSGQSRPATRRLGTVRAGETKVIEVELTARQAGNLTIQVEARGDAGAEARLSEKVAVYRPALQMDLQAPGLQFVGTDATYRIRVSNPGTAPARAVTVTATIPPGAEYVSNMGDGQVSKDGRKVSWTRDTLEVGLEDVLELTCLLAEPGLSRLDVVATAAGGLNASGDAAVQVDAIADLELDLSDPPGPVPVGSEATYQLRIQNRGTNSAENVEVVAYFSRGIEPTSVDGGRHRTAAGQVLFDKIPSLAAGRDVTFQIKAKADAPGNHICRVEVYCKPLGTRLVSEETTRFYGGTRALPAEAGDSEAETVQTADQRPTRAPRQTR